MACDEGVSFMSLGICGQFRWSSGSGQSEGLQAHRLMGSETAGFLTPASPHLSSSILHPSSLTGASILLWTPSDGEYDCPAGQELRLRR